MLLRTVTPLRRRTTGRAFAGRTAIAAVSGCVALTLLLPAAPALATATPTISAVSPTTTHVGRTVTVTGVGLEDATSVTVNGLALTDLVTTTDGSRVTATVPAGATDGPVRVLTASSGDVLSGATLIIAPSPAAVTALTGRVGYRFASLAWTASGTGPAIARDVTGVATPWTPASGRALPVAGATARDTTFTNRAARTYAVWATDADGTPSDLPTSLTVDRVAPVAPTLSLVPSASVVGYARSFSLSGRLVRAGVGVPGQPVDLLRRLGGSTSTTVLRHLSTAGDGSVRVNLGAIRNATYTLRFAGDAFATATSSPRRVVSVLPSITSGLSPSALLQGQASTLSGRMTPAVGNALVKVQRRSGTSWVDAAHVRTNAYGIYSYRVAPSRGTYAFRAVLAPTAGLLQAVSPARQLQVDYRDLSSGASGSDVLALQRRLAGLHYDVGTQDGRFGYTVQHAVMAFQKVERLRVTGRWSTAERTRANAPRGFALRYPAAGRTVEVSLTRQVLVVAESGRVTRIVDISSGNDELYTVDGVTERATTPRGRFRITRKIDGIRVSRLGSLYKPAYFYQGWAVHGSPSVPAYPASHGCLRVINPVMDRLFPILVVGTPIALYDE